MTRLIIRLPLQFSAVFIAVFAAIATGACDGDSNACSSSTDCSPGLVCSAGQCVGCAANSDCGVDQFCCQGSCRVATEVENRCGCSPAPGGSPGTSCAAEGDNALCLIGNVTATPDTVAQGTCGCSCTPAEGGPICTAPAAAGGEPTCTCDDDNANCRSASLDAAGRPHRVADTCTPDDSCVCFSLGNATSCDPDGAAPDCTSTGGCASLVDDVANCGSPGRDCTNANTGVADGICQQGGCSCDALEDCTGAGLNVNSCAFVAGGDGARCICNGYNAAGVAAACPMELECALNGCVLDGVAFATEESLRDALGVAN